MGKERRSRSEQINDVRDQRVYVRFTVPELAFVNQVKGAASGSARCRLNSIFLNE